MSEDDNMDERIRKIQESALSDLNHGDLTSSLKKYEDLTIAPDVNNLVDRSLLVRFWNKINSIDGLDVEEDARRKMFSKQWAEVIADVTSDELDAASDEYDGHSSIDSISDPSPVATVGDDDGDRNPNDHDLDRDSPSIIDVSSVPVSEYEGHPVEATFSGLRLEDYGSVRGYVSVNDSIVVLMMGEDEEDNVPFFTLGKMSDHGYLMKDASLRTLTVWSSAPSGFTAGFSSSVVDDSTDDAGREGDASDHDSNDGPIDPVRLADSIEQTIASYDDHDDLATRAGKFIDRYRGFNDLPLSDDENRTSEDHPAAGADDRSNQIQSDLPHATPELHAEDTNSSDNRKTVESPVFMVPSIGHDGDHDYSIFTMIADSSGAKLSVLRLDDVSIPVVSGDGKTVTIPYWAVYCMTGGSVLLVVDGISSSEDSPLKDMVRTLIHSNGIRVGSEPDLILPISGHVKIFILSSVSDVSRLEEQL